MAIRVNMTWVDDAVKEHMIYGEVTRTTAVKKAIGVLVMRFDGLGIPYKLYNLGAGVTKITTITDTCPCCKRRL